MAHNIALQPWEIEAGFMLCCQARPTTATLEVSYDKNNRLSGAGGGMTFETILFSVDEASPG